MDKSPQAFRTISEVAEALEVPAHVLRFWEGRFSQLRPMKSNGGRRYYRPEDVELLRGIRDLLYEDGMTIKGVQKIFREQGARGVVQRGQETGETSPLDGNILGDAVDPKPEMAEPDPETGWSEAPAAGRADTVDLDEPDPEELIAEAPPAIEAGRSAAIADAIGRLEAIRDRILRSLPR